MGTNNNIHNNGVVFTVNQRHHSLLCASPASAAASLNETIAIAATRSSPKVATAAAGVRCDGRSFSSSSSPSSGETGGENSPEKLKNERLDGILDKLSDAGVQEKDKKTHVKREMGEMLDDILSANSGDEIYRVWEKYALESPTGMDVTTMFLLKRELMGAAPFKVGGG